MDTNNTEEINEVQFINCHYRDVERYRDAFTKTPYWLINALDNKTIELKDYNPGALCDYGSYGVIHTDIGDKEFSKSDWITNKGNSFEIKKGEFNYDQLLRNIKKWSKIMDDEEYNSWIKNSSAVKIN